MIDVQSIRYKLIAILETGEQLDITGAAADLGWEEGEGELAQRISFTVYDAAYQGQRLSEAMKLGCAVSVIADWGSGSQEVARGTVADWSVSQSGGADSFSVLAYDELYSLQQSQDNRYIAAGTGTKAALTALFTDWGIPVGEYKGPDVPHAKTPFKNETISDIVLQLLDDAAKQGAPKCVVRAVAGAVSILPKGANEEIYHFDEDSNVILAKDELSIQRLVTRVKVVGTQDSAGRAAVEAVLDGQVQFGIRQRIYNRRQQDSLATATKAAQAILDEEGAPERTMRLQAPDLPLLRKGDRIHVQTQTLDGYYCIKSIQHNAASTTMSVGLEPYIPPDVAAAEEESGEFEKGDKVILNGAVYLSSYGNGKGLTFTNRLSTITIKVDTTRPCPYHLDWIGWVYPNTITKA